MAIYKTRWFARWARSEGLADTALCRSVKEMDKGLIDAQLGGQLVKKRVAAEGRGKSGSWRTIVAYRAGERAFFVYGFSKNERDNVEKYELAALKKLAKQYFGLDEKALARAVDEKALLEVNCDE